jgi:hypothetical protein
MKIAALLFVSLPAWGGYIYVNSYSQGLGANGGNTSAHTISMTGANLIGVCLTSTPGTTPGLSDSSSNSYTLAASQSTAGGTRVGLYYVYAPTVTGSMYWTVTGSGTQATISVLGVSGAASSPLDQHTTGANTGGSIITSITPTATNALVMSCLGGQWSWAYTKGGVTIPSQAAYSSGVNYAGAVSFQIAPTATSTSSEWHWKQVETDSVVTADFLPAVGTVYNVMSYGAVGNGSTNDTTAIQTAITACSNGTVGFPGGHTYLINATLTLTANCSYTQIGSGTAELNDTATCGKVLDVPSGNNNVSITGLILNNLGIFLDGGSGYVVSGVTIQNKTCDAGNQNANSGLILASNATVSYLVVSSNTFSNIATISTASTLGGGINMYSIGNSMFINGNTFATIGNPSATIGSTGLFDAMATSSNNMNAANGQFQMNNNSGTGIALSSLIEAQSYVNVLTPQWVGNSFSQPTSPIYYFALSLVNGNAGRIEDNVTVDANIALEVGGINGEMVINNYFSQDNSCTPYSGSQPPNGGTGCGGGGIAIGGFFNSSIINNVTCGPTIQGAPLWNEDSGTGNTTSPNYNSSSCTVSVTSASPSSGTSAGGTAVTITGTLFGYGSTVLFGSTPALNVSYVSATTIIVNAPAGTGTVNVCVTPPVGSSYQGCKSSAYTYSSSGAPTITTTSLPGGTIGVSYSQTLAATGGTPPYSGWTVSSGSLPAGLSLTASNGMITGTPTTAGTSSFSVTVTDSASMTSSPQALSIVISVAGVGGSLVSGLSKVTGYSLIGGGGPSNPPPPPPFITFVNSGSAGSGNTNTAEACGTSCAGINMAGANAEFVCVTYYNGTFTSLADSQSNTWNAAVSAVGVSGSDSTTTLYYALSASVSSSQTFTVTTSGGYPSIVAMGFSNVATSSALDQTNNSNYASQTSSPPGSVTPSTSGQLVIPCMGLSGTPNNSFSSVGGGFTLVSVPYIGGSYFGTGMAYLIQTTATASNPTFILSSSGTGQAVQASFK